MSSDIDAAPALRESRKRALVPPTRTFSPIQGPSLGNMSTNANALNPITQPILPRKHPKTGNGGDARLSWSNRRGTTGFSLTRCLLQSPGVLPSRGDIVASGGTGVPTPGRFSSDVAWPQLTSVRFCRRRANMAAAPHRGPRRLRYSRRHPPRSPTLRAGQRRLPFTRSSPRNSRLGQLDRPLGTSQTGPRYRAGSPLRGKDPRKDPRPESNLSFSTRHFYSALTRFREKRL